MFLYLAHPYNFTNDPSLTSPGRELNDVKCLCGTKYVGWYFYFLYLSHVPQALNFLLETILLGFITVSENKELSFSDNGVILHLTVGGLVSSAFLVEQAATLHQAPGGLSLFSCTFFRTSEAQIYYDMLRELLGWPL